MKHILFILAFTFVSIGVYARAYYEVVGNDVIVTLDGFGVKSKFLKVELWSENTVRIVTTMKDEFAKPEFSLLQRNEADIRFRAVYAQNNIEITTNYLYISISENGLIRLMDRKGRRLLVESDRSYTALDDDETCYEIKQSFFMPRVEFLYGLGQFADEHVYNLRGKTLELVQSENSTFMPVFYSDKGYAFIWDNYSESTFTDATSGLSFTAKRSPEISYFFVVGPEWDRITGEIKNMSPEAKLLPKWAYGHFPNPLAYSSLSEMEQNIQHFRSAGIEIETAMPDNLIYKKEKEITNTAKGKQFTNVLAYKQLTDEYNSAINLSSGERALIPTTINLPGIQQYGTYTVSAGVKGTWKALSSQISTGITSSLGGQLHWSTLPGGSEPGMDVNSSSFKELMVRWYQFTAFTPVFQSTAYRAGDWFFDSSNKETKAIADVVALRYSLVPYIYSEAANAVTSNGNIIKSLLFDFRDDEKVYPIDNQYMFGRSIMVCPVTAEGEKSREVYLPDDYKWYDFYTGQKYTGGKKIKVDAPIDRIPLLVKEGSIVPIMTKIDQGGEEGNLVNIIEIRIYPGADGQFVLYCDEGNGYTYRNGQSSKILFDFADRRNTLTINAVEGSFPGMETQQVFRVVYVSDDDKETNVQEVVYAGRRLRLRF